MLRTNTHQLASCSGHTHAGPQIRRRRVGCDRVRTYAAEQESSLGQATSAHTSSKPKGPFPYDSGDGRTQKATIEHVFSLQPGQANMSEASPSSGPAEAPWALGWQMNERNLVWNDALRLGLIKRIATDELGISEEEMDDRLQQLTNILPDLVDRFKTAPPKMVARLAGNTHTLTLRILRMRQMLPEANVSRLINGRLSLLLDEDLDEVEATVEKLRQLLPSINVDRFAEAFPAVLDLQSFEMALADARRLMPGMDIEKQLRADPDLVLGFMKGRSLIPYDQIGNPWAYPEFKGGAKGI